MVYAGAGAGSTGVGTATYSNNMATVTGLAALTSYDIYVSMNCTSVSSDWTGPVTITTLCNPVNLPVSQNFSGVLGTLPSCWTVADLNQDEYKWGIDANGAALLAANPVMPMDDWLFSGGVNLSAGVSYRVSFTYGALSPNNPEKLSLSLGSTADPSAMSNIPLWVNNGFNTANLSADLAFTVPTTGVYYLGWKGFSDGNTSGIILDNVSISVNPCGTVPSNLSVSTITASGASAFWNAVPNVTSYTWKVVPSSAGSAFTAVRTGTTTNLTTNITGLLSGVAYDLFIKANCSSNISSAWVGPVSFSTLTQTGLFASAGANDAYIDVNWALPVDNCLLNASSTPYSQGIYVELKDLNNNQIVYQEPIADLSPYIGEAQPTFTRVANGLNGTFYQISSANTGSYWVSNLMQWTIETWVKINPAITNATIWAATNGASNPVELKINGQILSLNNVNFSNTVIPHSRWVHIAVASTGTSATLYINGLEKETKTMSSLNMGNSVYSYQFLKNFNNGSMGELRLWNRVRSATEIANNRFLTSIPNANLVATNLFLHLRWNTANAGVSNTGYYSSLPINFLSGTPPTAAYIPTPNYTSINGTYRHLVGPSQNRTYQLNVRQIGSGLATVNCSTFTALGSTLAFQPPVLVSASDNLLDRVELTWTNKSKLAERYRISRSGVVRDIVLGTDVVDSVLTYQDVYVPGDSMSIVNGTNYNYCVEAMNNTLNQTYTQVCNNGNTFNLALAASDNTYPDKVVLTWANVSAFNYEVKVFRDGLLLATLAPTAATFTDNNALFGKIHNYTISLVDSVGIALVSDEDNGGIPAKGQIKGRALTLAGGYALKNVKIDLHSLVDTAFRATTFTDFKGEFSFSNLYFGQSSGNFELSAMYGNHTFGANPRMITLTNTDFVASNVLFLDSTGLTVSTTPLAVSNFVTTPNLAEDRVEMAWTYSPTTNDSTIFEIYREQELLAVLSNVPTVVNTFNDLTGIPQANYVYKLFAYKIQNGIVSQVNLLDTTIFPAITKPSAFTVAASATTGAVNLAWANTSTNIEGFNLYKNAIKIAELPSTILSYTDINVLPGSANAYSIKAKRKPNLITFESAAATANAVMASALPNLLTLTATASASNNRVNLVWTVPASLNNTYNFTGYRIYRKKATGANEYIGDVFKGRPTTFEDRNGVPGISYTYTVKTFRRMANAVIVESAGLAKTATFPVVSPPASLSAANNTVIGEVVMSWTPAYNNNGRNLHGQIAYRGVDTFTLPLTAATYRFMTNQTVSSAFGVRTFRIVEGKRYYSNAVTANAKPLASGVNPVLATNFKASQDLPNHVRLVWDYPNYVSSTFKVFRDNILLATLSTSVRTYQDYTAVPGANHLYQIQATNGANTSQRVGAWGSLKSIVQLSGMVASAAGNVGMPNVSITAMANNFYVLTRTDSAGYYFIDGLPALAGTTVTVLAEGNNSTFSPASKTLTITTDKSYTLDFGNTFTPPAIDTTNPGKPITVNAVADYARRRIAISWNQSNSSYDGVEVYRSTTLIGTINAGSNLLVYDEEGYPGITYVYALRPFIQSTPSTKQYGATVFRGAVFPIIESPLYLTATPKSEENKLTLTWSHRWDNHSYYAVERNGELITTLQAGTPLIWDDLTGEPGQQYTYTVTAVMNVNGNLYTSIPVSITANYPSIGEVKNLMVSVPSNTVQNACLVNYQRDNNHVLVSWESSTSNVDGYRVYRDNNLLAELPGNVTFYQDYTGLPGSLHAYTVKAVLVRNELTYNSSGLTLTKSYPALAQATALLSPINNAGAITLSWSYPENVINGFYIYYNGALGTTIPSDTIAIDSIGAGTFSYTHATGIPNLNYRYAVRAYTKREGATYLSIPMDFVCNNGSTPYPSILIPTNLQASDGLYEGNVVVTWDYPNDANAQGIAIYRGSEQLAQVPAGLHQYIDTTAKGIAEYTVKAYRTVDNTDYYSQPSTSNTGYPLIIATSLTGTSAMRQYGATLSESEELLLVGAPPLAINGTGYVTAYRFNDATRNWTTGGVLFGPGGIGKSISIYSNAVIAGAPYSTGSAAWGGTINANNDFAGNWLTTTVVPGNPPTTVPYQHDLLGQAVVSNANGFYYSDQSMFIGYNTSGGLPLPYSRTKAGAIFNYGNPVAERGQDNGQYLGLLMDGGSDGYLFTGKYNDSILLQKANTRISFNKPNGTSNNIFGYSLALSTQNDVIIGSPSFTAGTNGIVYIYNNGSTAPAATLYCPDVSADNRFGASVDIEGNFAIIGAPNLNNGKGAAYLYHKKNNLWNYIKKYEYGNNSPDNVGAAVRVGNFAVIGAPEASGGQGKIYWEDLRLGLMKNVVASKATYSNKTKVSWSFYPNASTSITGFKIYRDKQLIYTADPSDTYMNDETGIAGKHYIYEVVATDGLKNTIAFADQGWSKVDGTIDGNVSAAIGSAPIPNVKITAMAIINGDKYTYNTVTDNSGNYSFNEMFYGDSVVSYTITAEYGKHIFIDNSLVITLSPQTHVKTGINFYDKTAYTISGFVHQKDVNTGLDSIKVMAVHLRLDGTKMTREAYTDKEGKYSLTVNPGEANLEKISIEVDNLRVLTNGTGLDTTRYHFAVQGLTEYTSFTDFPITSILDILDTTRYQVRLSVLTACNTPLTGGKYRIKVQGVEADYEKTFTTSEFTGEVIASLPPLNMNINVESVENLNATTQLVVNYLKYRPSALDLYQLDKDTLYKISLPAVMDDLTHTSFVYHKPPTISVLSGFDTYMCNNSARPAIIQQGGEYTLELQIQETFNGSACDVKSGYMIVNNGAAETQKDTLYYVADSVQRFDKYVFTAGNPNLVAPYSHLLNIRYFSNSNNLLGEKNIAIIVEGAAQLPGADIIVDLSENGQVPIPMFVLRDPPGDGSSATIEEGSTTTKTISFSVGDAQHAYLGSEGQVVLGKVGIAWSVEGNVGKGHGKGASWEISATTTKSISTFDDSAPVHIGEQGDVMVGMGVSLQYGLSQQLKVVNCDSITKTTVLAFSPHSIQTQWMYTVGQIQLLVDEYANKIENVEKGSFSLQKSDGSYYTKEEAKAKLETYMNNWKKMLDYHKRETLPYYALCDKTGQQKAPEPYNAMANEWRSGFCPLVGTYGIDGKFNPTDNIIWDQVLADKYNAANTAIRKLESGTLTVQGTWDWQYDGFASTNSFVDQQYNLLHGVQAENVTFGSGVNYSKTFESAEAKAQSISLDFWADINAWLGIVPVESGTSIIAGTPFAGTETSIEATDIIAVKLGGGSEWTISEENETAKENTNLISYTLADDDDADQFSVTVIQGPATNLGPYFSLLGGRSSCPQEPGTIVRDRPDLRLYDPQTQATTTEQTKSEIPTDAAATFMLQITNMSVFNEARDFKLTLQSKTNPNGAIVTTMGQNLGYGPVILYGMNPDEPLIVPINVQRGLNGYNYEGLTIAIEPYCGNTAEATDEANLLDSTTNYTVVMNVQFKNPCSNITLVEPDDNWVINRRNVFDANSREVLFMKIMDYEATNEMLLSTRIEYRKLGAGADWQTIPNSILTKQQLYDWNEQNFVASQVPYYPYFWDITDDFARYPDGDYEIRIVAECGVGGQVYSRYAKGKIARQGQLFNNPEPADHIWTVGDEISVSFNRDLECVNIADSNFVVVSKTQANTFLPGKVTCYNNKLLFTPTLPLRYYDGDSLELIVSNVRTDNGYLMDTVRWSFVVIGKDIYVKPDSIKVMIEKGKELDVNAILAHNSEIASNVNYTFTNVSQYNHWLSSDNVSGSISVGEETSVDFHINTASMLLGTTTATLNLDANGTMETGALVIQVTVLPSAPNWEVNPADYTESMTLLSNFNFDNSNVKSQDTMDVISVWIDNQIRGVAKISKFTATNYAALIQVYGKSTDANKPLTFRVWDASEGKEYDAKPDNNATVSYTTNGFIGSVGTPSLLDIFTASDLARYIPLNKGWSWLSVASTNWNKPVNQSLASLKHPHTNDVIKTASKTASYLTGTGWVSTNGLDSTNAHRGYQIFLAEADTLRISGAAPSIKPIALANGWNLIGYPLQTEMPITSLNFSTTPTSMAIKTIATDPANYSTNMAATYGNSAWTYTAESKMDKLRPDFAYQLRVNAATQLLYPGANPLSSPIALRTSPAVDMADPSSWQVYPADFEYNQLITAVVDYNKTENTNAETKVLAYVGDECRGVGELVYVEELKRYMMQMMVYSNATDEPISFYIYDGQRQQSYDHHETLNFNTDNLVGKWEEPYHFSNVAADDAFTGSVYPNPFNRSLKLNLKSDKVQDFTVQLTDLTGRVLYTTAIDADNVNVSQTLNTQSLDLTDGVYLLQVVGSLGKTLSFKVVHQSN